jgi:hypothetical protein
MRLFAPALVLGPILGALAATVNVGCSHDGESAEGQPDGAPSAAAPLAPSAATAPPILDAGPIDAGPIDAGPLAARTERVLREIADAGSACGSKDLPACPLQQWMKDNAAAMLDFGEITTIAEDFDQIALFAPPRFGQPSRFPNWVSISKDGAAAARAGDLNAAKAACRGCHVQYLAPYHASFRGLPIHPALSRVVPP